MKKATILFPVFTSRLAEESQPQKKITTARVKSKESSNILRLINEDIERAKQLRREKSNKIEISSKQKQNNEKISLPRRMNVLGPAKNVQRIPSLQIQKIAKTQTYRTIIPQTANGKGSQRKVTAISIECRGNSTNMKLSGDRVVVARNRKEFSKINEELIYERRQNYLNSKFNERVSRLNSITQKNKQIYDRINSQRSHYSNQDLNKSYESNASISKRLSNSKISRRSRLSMSSQRSVSGSRCSLTSKQSAKSIKYHDGLHSKQVLKNKAAPKRLIKIESKNINQLKSEQFQNFATLFASPNNNVSFQSKRIQSKTARKNKDSSELKQNLQKVIDLRHKIKEKTNTKQSIFPSLLKPSKNIEKNENEGKQRVSSIRKRVLAAINENTVGINLKLCDVLHKIVEEPYAAVKRI